MSLRTVLFDLDGTLLPMDQDIFVGAYFKGLSAKLAPLGYDPKRLIDTIWGGTAAMIKNNGKKTNEEAFWDFFCSIYGTDARKDEPIFEEFYKTEFQKVKSVCGFDSNSAKIVHKLKNSGIRVVGKASNKRDLEPLNKCRGENKALQTIVQHLKAFGFKNGKVRIAHCFNEKAGKALKELLQAEFNKAQIKVCRCRGLCSFYAEKGGLLVGYEAK